MRTTSRLVVFLAVLGVLGCTLPFGGDDPPGPTPPTNAAPTEVDRLGQQTEKTNVYIGDCYNRVRDSIERSTTRYRDFIQRTGPDVQDVPHNGPPRLDPRVDTSLCRRAHARAAAMAPSMPELERTGEAYATQVERLVPILRELDPYYQRGSFRDDGLARGREIHARLMPAIRSYEEAERAFSAELDVVERRRMELRLAELETDPLRRGAFLVERTMFRGRQLLDQGQALILTFDRTGAIPASDREAYVSAVTVFEQEIERIQGYRPAQGEHLPEGFATYVRETEDMLRGQLRFMRYVRDNPHPVLRLLQRAFQSTVDGFNHAVVAYNRVRFRG